MVLAARCGARPLRVCAPRAARRARVRGRADRRLLDAGVRVPRLCDDGELPRRERSDVQIELSDQRIRVACTRAYTGARDWRKASALEHSRLNTDSTVSF